jgi:DNA-binding response OmpR family regulator
MERLRTVLIVDDDSQLRDIVLMTLSEPGYEVLTARDGYEAVRILVDRNVDLLLTDIRLPVMNGYELARQAKLMRPRLHVIYMSAYETERDRGAGSTFGNRLSKPIRPAELIREVNREMGIEAETGR